MFDAAVELDELDEVADATVEDELDVAEATVELEEEFELLLLEELESISPASGSR